MAELWRWHTHPRAAPPAEARRQDEVPVRRVSSPVATAACWRTLGASVSRTYHLRATGRAKTFPLSSGWTEGWRCSGGRAGKRPPALLGATRAVSGACEAAVGALLSETVPASDEGWKELLISAFGRGAARWSARANPCTSSRRRSCSPSSTGRAPWPQRR